MFTLDQIKTGLRNPGKAARFFMWNPVIAVTSRWPIGTHVLERDWDVLVVLDTCRVDAMRIVADEYEFIERVDRVWSLGGNSPEWIAHTFDRKHAETIANTAYVNANGWAERIIESRFQEHGPDIDHREMLKLFRYGDWDVVHADELGLIEHVWRYGSADVGSDRNIAETLPDRYLHGRALPRPVTDRGISLGREHEFDRLILHYQQPHAPHFTTAFEEGRDLRDHELRPFEYIKRTGDRETVFETYLDELRYVLDDVELLLDNIDADRVVISADHGEAFGEYGTYGHHAGSLHPQIRYVPWVETSATDTGSYEPQVEPETATDSSVEKALEALGYKT